MISTYNEQYSHKVAQNMSFIHPNRPKNPKNRNLQWFEAIESSADHHRITIYNEFVEFSTKIVE